MKMDKERSDTEDVTVGDELTCNPARFSPESEEIRKISKRS